MLPYNYKNIYTLSFFFSSRGNIPIEKQKQKENLQFTDKNEWSDSSFCSSWPWQKPVALTERWDLSGKQTGSYEKSFIVINSWIPELY